MWAKQTGNHFHLIVLVSVFKLLFTFFVCAFAFGMAIFGSGHTFGSSFLRVCVWSVFVRWKSFGKVRNSLSFSLKLHAFYVETHTHSVQVMYAKIGYLHMKDAFIPAFTFNFNFEWKINCQAWQRLMAKG